MKLIQLYLEALCYHLLSEGAGVSTEAPQEQPREGRRERLLRLGLNKQQASQSN